MFVPESKLCLVNAFTEVNPRNFHKELELRNVRFISYRRNGVAALGALKGEKLFGSAAATLTSLLAAGGDALQQTHVKLLQGEEIDVASIEYLPPFATPEKIICVGLNYKDHAAESGFQAPSYPALFSRYASSLVGHNAAIVRPNVSDQLDYEGELVAIIGKGGRDIPLERALDHVAGYSIFNDGSIRDYQFLSRAVDDR